MMKCNKCMKEVAEGSLFCPNCGNSLAAPAAAEPVPEVSFCPECGNKAEAGTLFCAKCGTRLGGAAEQIDSMEPEAAAEEPVIMAEPAAAAEEPVVMAEPEAAAEEPAAMAEPEAAAEEPVVMAEPEAAVEEPVVMAEPEAAPVTVVEETPLSAPAAAAPAQEASFCSECGSRIEAGSLFCDNCGTRVGAESEPEGAAASFCPECGSSMEADSEFCGNCGYRLSETPAPGIPAAKAAGKTKLPLILGGAAVIAVAAIAVIAIPKLLSGGSGTDTVMYLKDGGMYSANLKKLKKDPVELTDDTYGSSSEVRGLLRGYRTISPDGKYKFYLEDIDADGGFTLYYKKKDKDPGEKIDGNITRYNITPDNKVVYIKNGALYVSDLADKSKIASDVSSFELEEGGKRVLWTESDDTTNTKTIYYSDVSLDAEKEKLASDITNYYRGEDFNTIYLIKNDAVYLVKNLTEEEKLVNDVTSIIAIDPKKNAFYYREYEELEIPAIDFVEDDMAAADAQIQEPRMEDFQSQQTAGSGWRTSQRTVTDYDGYNAARDKYFEKLERDELREALKDRKLSVTESRLYYYVDGEETLISENLADTLRSGSNWEDLPYAPYVLFTQFESENMEKLKLSELNYAGDVDNAYYSVQGTSRTTCLVSNGVTVTLDLDEEESLHNSYAVDKQKGMLYGLVQDDPEDEEYRLISIDLNEKTLGEITEKDDDVAHVSTAGNGYVYYMKETDDRGDGDLYCNGEEILSDVAANRTRLIEDGMAVVCMADWNYNSNDGTMVLLQGSKETEIADDISDWYSLEDGTFLLLSEYNYERQRGDLKYYDGKEVQSVDDDVRAVLCPIVEE